MPAARVCAQPGCPNIVSTGRCKDHARPGPRQRGYDTKHDKIRAEWAPRVATGQVDCWRCGERITPPEPWDLGHITRSAYGGPEHANRCNRAAAGRESHN